MNSDQIKSQWKEVEAAARRTWAKLTDDDWRLAAGDIDKLAGRIQARYGEAKEAVAAEIARLLEAIDDGARKAAGHVEGHWKQIEGEARLLWGKLTEDDWKLAAGDIEKLSEVVQKRYGYARPVVARQLNMLIDRIRGNAHLPYQSGPGRQAQVTP